MAKKKQQTSKRKPSQKKAPKIRRKRARKIVFWLLILGLFLPSSFVFSVYMGFWGPIPTYVELANLEQAKSSKILSSRGDLIGSIYKVNRDPVSFDDLPKHLIEALVATEDERFFEHNGIDPRSLARVLVKSIVFQNPRAGGGSTLTQQLAKNLFGRKNYGKLSMPVNKTREALIAYRFEKLYSKNEILALYLNTVSFSENTYGIGAGSRRFFSCHPQDLKAEQSAVLVGLLKANTYYNPRLNPEPALRRRAVVFQQMLRNNYLNERELDSLQALPLRLRYQNLALSELAPHYLVQMKRELKEILANTYKSDGSPWDAKLDGLIISTTLDNKQQEALQTAYADHLANWQTKFDNHWTNTQPWTSKPDFFKKELEATPFYKQLKGKGLSATAIKKAFAKKRPMALYHPAGFVEGSYSMSDSLAHYINLLRGASVIIDPNSGAIRSWIGGPNYRYLPYDAARGVHTLASTFKPIVMAAALEAGYDPCQYQSAERRAYRKYNNWAPQNYNKKYEGFYSMEGTLQKSINTSTVAWYFQTGEARVKAQAKALGLTDNWPDGPSVALGTAAASPIQLALAYAAFANGGTLHEAYFIERITTTSGRVLYSREKKTGQRVLSQRTAALINSMLQTAVLSGTGSAIPLRYGAASSWAGKTGTSQSYSDAWFVAYKPDVVSVTWMGGMNPIIRFRTGGLGSGSAMALPVFGSLVKSYENKLTNADWPDLNEKWLEELDCTTYRDQNLIDRLESIFLREDDENQPLDNDVPQEEGDEKKPSSWLKRLLDKVKN